MLWTDVFEIAVQLADLYPEIDPQWISFPDLHSKVIHLANFNDEPNKSNEKILEAIQTAWIEEYQ
jgi:FeS assembly protein IscX